MKTKDSPSYLPDLLFIKLPALIAKDLLPEDADGNVSLDLSHWRLNGYLFHEWLHYVHNTSTLNGLYAFASMISMWANFRHKLDHRGQSVVGNVLTDYAAASVKRTHLYRRDAARRERNMGSVLRNPDARVTVVSVAEQTEVLPAALPGHEPEPVTVIVGAAQTLPDQLAVSFEVGTVEIIEGVAFLLEEKLLMTQGLLAQNVRTAPYKLLQLVARHMVDDIPDELVVAAGITALQTADPALALMRMLREMPSMPPAARMAWLEASAKASLCDYEPLIADVIQKTAVLFPVEEPMGIAVKELLDLISSKMVLRRHVPFFELTALKELKAAACEDHRADLLEMMLAEYSCPRILAERERAEDTIGKDRIYGFGWPSMSEASLFGAQMLHGALHYLSLHLNDEGFVATDQMTAGGERKRCPFYDACEYDLRRTQPTLCAHRPWDSLAVPTDPREACWYRAGVRATRPPQHDLDELR
ncbi:MULTISPECIES: hypothetical protein [Cupriavidus]|jgi:hypothetical protein|uniref:Uncharacterized protein n=1 Tax=Cupriavidus campinensis TaxID=151783 RepID=A0AAE9I4J7_9BURK|nr:MULTISPECIES: hypothetical protein [Cupriavidus]MCM3606186.1 hypothetical protein [Cupriavidus pauculus]MDT6961268.1 hypothetical protein [Cupriavidus sp. SZY C1]MWL89987.1 hypothetical protein [Cupriavidus sp. SW-Y-13]TSP12057.1 hypothetical protein FGG12_13630 [Cupriavidus campinensis]URF06290.1 hypothetical protein M5D45_24570 [Cupriavidus campinensis]